MSLVKNYEQVANRRSVIVPTSIFHDKANARQTARAHDLYDQMCATRVAAGYQQYRASVTYMDCIPDPASGFAEVATRSKLALHPQDMIAPRKDGIGAR